MRTGWRRVLTVLGALAISVFALEALYRFQVLDTYGPELRSFNSEDALDSRGRPTLLIMGDSFSAGRRSYAGILQDTLRASRVVNGAVSGTGVLQALYMAPKRFSRFRPSLFIYQVYVGNDLFDVRYPVNWRTVSPARNAYWLLANYVRALGFANYRAQQLRQPATAPADAPEDRSASLQASAFSVDRYDARVKTYLRAEPGLIEDSILVKRGRHDDYETFLQKLSQLVGYCEPGTCRAYVLVIPHVSQVNGAYITYMKELGASFAHPEALGRDDYPFVAGIRDRFRTSANVEIINPLPELRAAQAQRPVYFANDEHLNRAGQQEIAALLQRRLRLR